DPNAWRIVDGRLYLNANKRVQGTWEKDIPGFIAQADSNWPVLAAQ
ncbi:MAG: YHS domain-containing protein, partial [Cyanobacteria bacterium J06635_11]